MFLWVGLMSLRERKLSRSGFRVVSGIFLFKFFFFLVERTGVVVDCSTDV